ncbi:MAG: hypothetical protein PUE95_10515 [Lachnospiraceae bacterium]|nr:hypothetical protein [Lachnospiraceae bacterium]
MASNEDYLDSLLKAAMDSEQAEQDPTETLVEQQLNTEIEKTVENTETMDSFSVNDDPNRSLTPEEIAAMFAELSGVDEINESDETNESDVTSALDTSNASETINEPESTSEPEIPNDSETFDIGDVMEEAISEEMIPDEMIQEEVIQPDEDPFQTDEELEFDLDGIDDIDALLGLKEMPPDYKDSFKQNKDSNVSDANDNANDENDENDEAELDLEDQDLSDILDLLGEDDSELAEINDILKKSDNNEIVDVDGISELEINMSKDIEDGQEDLEAENKTEKKKKKKKRFGKKKTEENAEVESNESGEDASSEIKEKKQNFFSKLMASLTEEIEDETEEENNQEMNPDAPAKKGKKKKGKKKDKQAETNEEILEEMDKEDAEASKKKKKEKKTKKKKEKKIKPVKVPETEQPGKKLPQKMVIRIFVLCFSILAVILIVNSFIPGLLSLQKARKAFYKGNYTDAYMELIAQDKLNESDTILLKKAEILTKLDNKMKRYRTYTAAGMKLEGLHTLLEGVSVYQDNQTIIQEYGISYEAEQLYSQIVAELMQQYGLTSEQINEILQLDSVSYTYRLRELTNNDNAMSETANPTLDELGGMDENSAPIMPDVDTLEDPLQEELE